MVHQVTEAVNESFDVRSEINSFEELLHLLHNGSGKLNEVEANETTFVLHSLDY